MMKYPFTCMAEIFCTMITAAHRPNFIKSIYRLVPGVFKSFSVCFQIHPYTQRKLTCPRGVLAPETELGDILEIQSIFISPPRARVHEKKNK